MFSPPVMTYLSKGNMCIVDAKDKPYDESSDDKRGNQHNLGIKSNLVHKLV